MLLATKVSNCQTVVKMTRVHIHLYVCNVLAGAIARHYFLRKDICLKRNSIVQSALCATISSL